MPTNFSKGLPREQSANNYTPLGVATGMHDAYMIGFTQDWTQTDSCYDCNQRKPNPPDPNCKKCEGSGNVEQTYIGIKYEFPDGHIEQERLTLKISEPHSFTTRDGRFVTTKTSKLYERLTEFTKAYGNKGGERGWGQERLANWANEHQSGEHIPVTLIVKQPGKYPKITEVVYRAEQQSREDVKSWGQEAHPFDEGSAEDPLDDSVPF